jgi:uncharacterized repeat protein (TIGR01451 family)
VLGSVAALLAGGSASGQGSATITAPNGPLTAITISDTLNCSVNHTGDNAGEFFGDTACGTFLAVGGTVYGPTSIPAGGVGQTPFTPVSQSAVTGSGTAGNPYKIVTVVDAGQTGFRITETDSYVVGQEAYRTDVAIANATGAGAIVYRAGDCYLQNSDTGYGRVDGGAVACRAVNMDGTPGDRIEQWFPLTSGSQYVEDHFSTVWTDIATQRPFPNTCICETLTDNGAGLSWSISGSKTVSHLTTFSPTGTVPLAMTKTADSATARPGAADAYTITISNPNPSQVTVSSVYDDLPSGFSYTVGSTTGATTADPSASDQRLTWSGIVVPAAGSASIHFGVTVSSTPGTYTNSASGDAGNFALAETGPTAPIEVRPVADLQVSQSVEPSTVVAGETATYTLVVTNGGPDAASNVVLTDTLGSGLTFVSANATQGGCSGTGPISCALGGLANGASATVTLAARAGDSGSLESAASVGSDQSDPAPANNTASAATVLLPPPVPGKKVNAVRVRGRVLVDGRELVDPEQVRVGAVIDTSKGEVRLITRNGDANFFSGIFQLRQKPSANAVTELRMRGGNFKKACKQQVRQASLATSLRSKKPVRKLWGKGKGKFRTRARYSSATVRGTYWLTSDRCDGTLTTVREGRVAVVDFVRHRTIVLTRGQSYLARPRR